MSTDAKTYLNQNKVNKLTSTQSLLNFSDELLPRGYLPVGTNITLSKQMLDDLLKTFNLKRGCCLRSENPADPEQYIVSVLVPNTSGNTFPNTPLGNLYKKIGYHDIYISYPKTWCQYLGPPYTENYGSSCQNFYDVYCKNMIDEYKKANNGVIDNNFLNFRPECACYLPIPKNILDTGINVVPSCVLPGCDKVNGVYLDSVSLGNDKCSLTICQAKIDYNNLTAGQNINVQGKIQQTCGGQKPTTSTTGTGTDTGSNSNVFDIANFLNINGLYNSIMNYGLYIGGALAAVCLLIFLIIILMILLF